MTKRRPQQRAVTPWAARGFAEHANRVLEQDEWEQLKHSWVAAPDRPPQRFWYWERCIPASLRRRHPARPAGPSLGEEQELLAAIRRYRENFHARREWLEEQGGDWKKLLS